MQTLVIVHFLGEQGKPNLDLFQGPVFPEIYFFNLKSFKKLSVVALSYGFPLREILMRKPYLRSIFKKKLDNGVINMIKVTLSPGFDLSKIKN